MGTSSSVLYVEPNYSDKTTFTLNGKAIGSQTYYPDPEKYSVVVDLLVEVPVRAHEGKTSQGGEMFHLSYTNGKTELSFFKGTRTKDGNFLTTAPYEYTTHQSINTTSNMTESNGQPTQNSYVNGECFGISSIDITFDSFQTPQVQMEFTDIRGVSLFGAEQIAHHSQNQGMRNIDSQDTAGSFFKCFFKCPYPKFTLIVKGFYGEPLSYQLTCSDFRAKFDCNTGNFNATVKFVGYIYSFLGDITLPCLVTAPYDKSYGKKYWESQGFTFKDGTNMLTIAEICGKMVSVKQNLATISEEKKKALDSNTQQSQSITVVQDCSEQMDVYFKEGVTGSQVVENIEGKIIIAVPNSTSEELVNTFKTNMENRKKILDEAISAYTKTSIPTCVYNTTASSIEDLKNTSFITEGDEATIKQSLGNADVNSYKYFVLNSTDLKNKIKNEQEELTTENNNITQTYEQNEEDALQDALGFKPTIENIITVLFAHLDTYVHSLCAVAKKANSTSRTLSTLKLTKTDLNVNNEGTVPAFPRVIREKTKNGQVNVEDDWIGNLDVSTTVAPEINFINGMLMATNDLAKMFNEFSSGITSAVTSDSAETSVTVSSIEDPSGAIDFTNDRNWLRKCNTNDSGEFAGTITLRAFSTIGVNSSVANSEYVKTAAINDAKTFAKKVSVPSVTFLDGLNGNTYTADAIYDAVTNTSQIFQTNGTWPWARENSTNALIEKSNNNNDLLTLNSNYNIVDKDSGVCYTKIPCENIGFEVNNGGTKFVYTADDPNCETDETSSLFVDFYGLKYGQKYDKLDANMQKNMSYMKFDSEAYVNKIGEKNSKFCKKFQWPGYIKFGDIVISREVGYDLTNDRIDKVISKAISDEVSNSYTYVEMSKIFETYPLITDYSLASIPGLIINNTNVSITHKYSIFGQPSYYSQTDDIIKGLLILTAFQTDLSKFNSLAETLTKTDNSHPIGGYLPISFVLLLGGMFKYQHTDVNIIANPFISNYIKWLDGKISIVENLQKGVKLYLIKLFDNWLSNDYKELIDKFELRLASNEVIHYSTIQTLCSQCLKKDTEKAKIADINESFGQNFSSLAEFYNGYFSKTVNETYASFDIFAGATALNLTINHEHCNLLASTIFMTSTLIDLMLKPVFFLKKTDNLTIPNATETVNNSTYDGKFATIKKDTLKNYYATFITQLKEEYKDTTPQSSPNIDDVVIDGNVRETVQNAYYKYSKTMYDNWLSGRIDKGVEDEFSLNVNDSFPNTKLHFIDSYFNKVGQDIVIDMTKFTNNMVTSLEEPNMGYQFLSFLGDIASTNMFHIQTVHNFLDLTGTENASHNKIMKLFDPIPYNEMARPNESDNYPDLIFMHNFEPSSKLNMGSEDDFASGGDSFDISNENDLPQAIKLKDVSGGKGYRIPAFGVTYGMGNQSYFTNIDISMDNPVATEASLQAQYNIATAAIANSNASEGGETPNNVSFLGQDLFTVYSNYSYACTVTMLGCAYIQPLMYFQLNNIPLFNGAYIIYKVAHHIEPGKMTTTFTGNRVCNVQSPKVSEAIVPRISKQQGLTDDELQASEDNVGRTASIDNNCAYKYFSPSGGDFQAIPGHGPRVNVDVLCGTLDWTKGYKSSHKFRHSAPNANLKLVDYLAITARNEGGLNGSHDDLGYKLNLVTIYNIYQKYGPAGIRGRCASETNGVSDASKYSKFSKASDLEKARKYVREIFENSPTVLQGVSTYVETSCPIYSKGEKTGKMTKGEPLSLLTLQSITSYSCFKYFFDSNYSGSCDKKRNGSTWEVHCLGGEYSQECAKHRSDQAFRIKDHTYFCQHEWNPGRMDAGHIYTGSEGKCWEITPTSNSASTATNSSSKSDFPSSKAQGLYDAIVNTCNYSSNINIKSFKIEKNPKVADSFYMTCDPLTSLPQVFDAILQTYYDDFNELKWCVESDTSSTPYKIYVNCNGKNKKMIGVGVKQSDGTHKITPFSNKDYSGGHKFFYTSLKKKYGDITSSNVNTFRGECRNFSNDVEGKPEDVINNILNYTVQSCVIGGSTQTVYTPVGNSANLSLSEKWKECTSGKYSSKPNGVDKTYTQSLVTSFQIKTRDSNGQLKMQTVTMNKFIKDKIIAMFDDIYEKTKFQICCQVVNYCHRNVNNGSGAKKLSMHAFGVALDINAIDGTNSSGKKCYLNPFPGICGSDTTPGVDDNRQIRTANHELVKIMAAHGFGWGGRYKDYMHFSYMNGG